MLRRAEVGETPADDGVVEPGMIVTYRFVGDDDETETFLLGAREMEDDDDDLEVYSPQSPLGSAIIGKQKGDTVTYKAPTASSSRSRSSTRCRTPADRPGRLLGRPR